MSCGRLALLAAMMALALAQARHVRGDGGLLRLCQQCGPYQVTVFTSPTPLRAGPVDFSVLVQDAATSAVVSDAKVVFRMTPAGEAGAAVDHVATTAAATNKLLKAAQFELPSAGTWQVEVLVDGPLGRARTQFPVEVSGPMPRWLEMAPWIALPLVPIALFALREAVARGKRRQPPPAAGGGCGSSTARAWR